MDDPDTHPDTPQTADLLARLRAGDRGAFDELCARYRPGLRAFVEARLGGRFAGRVDASDVVQEALLEAHQRLPDFLRRRPMPLRTWLWKTAYERLLKIRRHHGRARRAAGREIPWPDRSSLLLVRDVLGRTSPSRRLEEQELAQRVRRALAELGEADREVLLMRHVEQLPYEEVGHLLDLDPAAARQRYGRALLRLRKVLLEHGLLEENP
jgi:RNA polymerase sigma-70 factor (ECF subfamily)